MLTHAAGRILRHKRFDAGLTLDQLAKRAGVSVTSIVRIESGNRSVRELTVYAVAKALGIDPAELFEIEGAEAL